MWLVDDSLDGGWSWLLGDSGWYSHRGSTSGDWWWIGFPKFIKIRVPPVPDICHLRWQWLEILKQSQMVFFATPKRIETQLFITILLGFYYSIFFGGPVTIVKQNDAQCPISVRPSCKRWSRRTWRNELSERAWRSDASGFSVFLFLASGGTKSTYIYCNI